MKPAVFLLYRNKIKALMSDYYSSNQCSRALETLDDHYEYESAIEVSAAIYDFCHKKFKPDMTKKEMKGRYLDTLELFFRLVELHAELMNQLKIEFTPYRYPDISFSDLITLNNQLFALL